MIRDFPSDRPTLELVTQLYNRTRPGITALSADVVHDTASRETSHLRSLLHTAMFEHQVHLAPRGPAAAAGGAAHAQLPDYIHRRNWRELVAFHVTRPPSNVTGLWKDAADCTPLSLNFHLDGTGLEGGRHPPFAAQAQRLAVDNFGNLAALRAGLTCPSHHAIHPLAGCSMNLFLGLGDDHRASQARFWELVGQQEMPQAVQLARQLTGGRTYCTCDGALLQHQTGVHSRVCPLCGRTSADYVDDPSPATMSVADTRYDLGGVGFTHVFTTRRGIFTDLTAQLFPPTHVVWGPKHCYAHALSYHVKYAIPLLREELGEQATKTWCDDYAAAAHIRNGKFNENIKLDFEEFKRVFRCREALPPTGVDYIDRIHDTLFLAYDTWNRCISPRAFSVYARSLRRRWIDAYGQRMPPSVHNLLDHLPRQWALSGDPHFPRNVSDEAPEAGHQLPKRRWKASIETTVNPHTGETGLDEVFRHESIVRLTDWLPRRAGVDLYIDRYA